MDAPITARQQATPAASPSNPASYMALRIGILLGSTRAQANAPGLSAWVSGRLNQKLAVDSELNGSETLVIDANTEPLPLGPIEGIMAAVIKPPEYPYPDPRVRQWSELVRSLDGICILTPQHNWGIPGEWPLVAYDSQVDHCDVLGSLKTNLDHLYFEWHGKPVAAFTYGGHGGNKAAAQLETVLKGGLKMELVSVSEVMVTLPRDYIGGEGRVTEKDTKEPDGFLLQYNEKLDAALDALLAAIAKKKQGDAPV